MNDTNVNLPEAKVAYEKATEVNLNVSKENLSMTKNLIWHEIDEAIQAGLYSTTCKSPLMAKEEAQFIVDWLRGFGYNVSVLNTIRSLDKINGFHISWSKE